MPRGPRDLSARQRTLPCALGPAALVAVVGLCLSLAACQSGSKGSAAPKSGTPSASGGLTINEAEPFAGLKALSQRQRQSPDTKAQTLAPPPGIEGSEVAPLADLGSDSPATASLDTVLAKFTTESTPPTPPAQTANPQALHLYVTGRAKLVDGQPGKAVTDLEAATRLDPSVPEPWRELGEAQMQLGRRTSGMASYQKAIKLGLDEPRLFDLLARDSIKSKKFDEAAKLLV